MATSSDLEMIAVTLVIVLVFALMLSGTLGQSAAARGRDGEREVSWGVSRALDSAQYHLLDNLTFPFGNSTTQIDHLVVSQHGVFVIETKNMAGWIFGDEKQAQWTQVIYRVKYKFQNPLRQNFKHVKTVQNLFGLKPSQVHSVVVFVGDCTFKTKVPQEVALGVSELISNIESKKARVIAEEDVIHLLDRIQSTRMSPGRKTERDHLRNVESARNVSARDENVACPRCGNLMVERINKLTGERFLGCERFPKCRGIRRITDL